MKNKINMKFFIFTTCFIVLIFQNVLQRIIPFLKYFDELLSLLVLPVFVIRTKKKGNLKIHKNNYYIIILYLLLIVTGMYSSLKYKYQTINVSLSDLLLVSKFFAACFLSELLWDVQFVENYKSKISLIPKTITILFSFLTILNYLFKIWPQKDYRFGIMSNQLFFEHPTYLAASCILLLVLLLISSNEKKSLIYIVLDLLILLSTLRFKAIGAAIVVVFFIIYISKTDKKISVPKLLFLSIIVLIISWNQISFYYLDLENSARNVLTRTSFKIASDYFPLGTGFGTFASYISGVYYSPIYSMYGISNLHELQKGRILASDVFWPMIIAQFGLFGTICYVGMLILLFRKIQEGYSKDNKKIYIAKIVSFTYLLISSISESAFVHPIAIPFALIIGVNTIKTNCSLE